MGRILPQLAVRALFSYNASVTTIAYDLTLEDMEALTLYHSERSPRERRRRRLVQGLIVLVFLFLLYSAFDTIRSQGAGLSAGWIAASSVPLICPTILLVLVFSGGVRRWSNNRSVHKAFAGVEPGGKIATQQVTLAKDGISVRADAGELALAWPEVVDVTKTADHLLIFGTSEQAMAVPRRAFSDPAAFDAFYDEIQTYRGQPAAA